MNSLKTAFVSLILLGVLYGMYQVLQAPPVALDSDGYMTQEAPTTAEVFIGEEEISPDDLFAEDDTELALIESSSEAPALVKTELEENEGISPPELGDLQPQAEDEPDSRVADPNIALIGKEDTVPSGGGFVRSQPEPISESETGQFGTGNLSPETVPPITETPDNTNLASRAMQVPSPLFKRSRNELTDVQFKSDLSQAWVDAEMLVNNLQYAQALNVLSYFYGDRRLSLKEEEELLTWLDALAAKVLYSTEHHLFEAYIVQSTDTLSSIATAHGITEDLLYNINQTRFGNDGKLFAGLELKVIQGPVHAEMDVTGKTLTLFSGEAYAGRFELNFSPTMPFAAGSYTVLTRTNGLTSGDSATSGYSIGLANGIEFTEIGTDGVPPNEGIGLAMNDMFDVYSILSKESVVTIVD
ncbi:MAG: LysM domain-containing protein [Planctomycetota bacterium]|nr:LysM domain-containing protein [Planctomycetota bacterium]MEE3031849.1 LysM domain-containing protein [Planctomycetota bacterium]